MQVHSAIGIVLAVVVLSCCLYLCCGTKVNGPDSIHTGIIKNGRVSDIPHDDQNQFNSEQIVTPEWVSRKLSADVVFYGICGCSFHMDVKEMYRFTIDADNKTVNEWNGEVGQAKFDSSFDKKPVFEENSVQGMHGLALHDERYFTCELSTPANVMHAFVVYLTDSGNKQEVLMTDLGRSFELKTISGSPLSIAVGAATSLNNVTTVHLGADFNGSVAEVVVFSRLLTPQTEQAVYNRLVKKWIERTPRHSFNMFKTLLNKSDKEVNRAVVSTAYNLNANFYNTSFNFRGDVGTVFTMEGGTHSNFNPEWLAAYFYTKNKILFDKAVNMMERYHWVQDTANDGSWYFFCKVYIEDPLYRTTYSGQGNHGYLGEVLFRAWLRWREPRYLELASRTMKFWLQHNNFGETRIKSFMFTEDNAHGYGTGIVKMFKNHILDDDAFTEITYMAPVTARMTAEFGPPELNSFYDFAPHAQNCYLVRSAHPVTGLMPSTARLDGTPVAYNGDQLWARFSNDVTEKAFDRFLGSLLNYPQDADADVLASLRRVAAWADRIGVRNLLSDYELDGTRDNPFHTYKNGTASEGMRASIASLAAIAHDFTADMTPWVDDVWQNLGNTDRSLRGYARSVFVLSGAVKIENDALPRNYVLDPGFEGDFGWSDMESCTVEAAGARRGARGLTCLDHSPFPLLDATQFIKGATYRYTAWIRSASGASSFQVKIQRDGTGGMDTQFSSSTTVGSEWQLVSMPFTILSNEDTLSIKIQVVCDSSTAPFNADDINITFESSPVRNVQDMLDVRTTTTTTDIPLAPPIPYLYVAGIKMGFGTNKKRTKFNGRALVTIRSNADLPVSGASVLIEWSGASFETSLGTTGSDGRVKFVSKRVKGGGTFTIRVVDVFPPLGHVYLLEQNAESEGSVDATSSIIST